MFDITSYPVYNLYYFSVLYSMTINYALETDSASLLKFNNLRPNYFVSATRPAWLPGSTMSYGELVLRSGTGRPRPT